MSLTREELKKETDELFKSRTLKDWKTASIHRDIVQRSQKDFDYLIPMYVDQVDKIRQQLRGPWNTLIIPTKAGKLKTPKELGDELTDQLQNLLGQEARMMDKFAVCCKEVEMRKNKNVERSGLHEQADYFIDYDNGIDTAAGIKQGNFTADAGTNATTIVDAELDGLTITDNAASSGDFVWNVTRNAGSYVDAWNDGTDTITLTGVIAGQTTGDTYYIISAWKTITQYTTTTVRTPGDRAFLRANITWDQGTEAVDITFDESGNCDNYISIIGCDSTTNDPWEDGSDVLPIVDFENAAFQVLVNSINYWYFERLDFTQTNDANGAFFVNVTYHCKLKSCIIRDATSNIGMYINASTVTLDSCTIDDCNVYGIQVISSNVHCASCTFDAGAGGTAYGIYIWGGTIFLEDCDMDNTAFDTAVIGTITGYVYLRNCPYQGTLHSGTGRIYSEDDDGVFEAHKHINTYGQINRDTGTIRSGGADSSAKMEPSVATGPNSSLMLGNDIIGFHPKWCEAGSYTVTVYARVGSAWDTALTAAEAYIVTSELDNAGNANRLKRQSAQQIANDGTWTAFTTNISPARTGFVYVWFYLAEYEDATEHIFVDIEPIVA